MIVSKESKEVVVVHIGESSFGEWLFRLSVDLNDMADTFFARELGVKGHKPLEFTHRGGKDIADDYRNMYDRMRQIALSTI